MKAELELVHEVERQLKEGNFQYKKGWVIGDARPDFVVTTENGGQVVVEVKAWEATPINLARAIKQAKRYKKLSKATAAFVVTSAWEPVVTKTGGVIPYRQLASELASLTAGLAQMTKKAVLPPLRLPPEDTVFASMPFAAQYDDTFLVAIEPAALANTVVAERVDHSGTTGNVVSQIQSMIRAAKVVVADLSESRPNMLHEVGFAEGLPKPVIQICSTPTSELPFNVRNNRTIPYAIGQTAKLKKRLEVELRKVILSST